MTKKKSDAQLDKEIAESLRKQPSHSRKKSGWPGEKRKTIGGYKVTIREYKSDPALIRFAAFYDLEPNVVGRGATEAEAIANLKQTSIEHGKRRQYEIEREDWAQHEAEKERRLSDDDY